MAGGCQQLATGRFSLGGGLNPAHQVDGAVVDLDAGHRAGAHTLSGVEIQRILTGHPGAMGVPTEHQLALGLGPGYDARFDVRQWLREYHVWLVLAHAQTAQEAPDHGYDLASV